eukprot:TRINITY_DN1584_c0_g1_i1.p2 TRINITY_DN1584_c0_g1~~TRINITY_DN1584_c0_g1_i1.p2  ORF type:complete len:372 (+),score=97.84 TRINITY_DN1584_c0_g1_i1:284-1399(+)
MELTRRAINSYYTRYAKTDAWTTLGGVYQSFETCIGCGDLMDELTTGYQKIAELAHAMLPDKKFVVSPYSDLNLAQFDIATLEMNKENFKALARIGCDVIAPQEGRGTGKGAYFYPQWQNDTEIKMVDPALLLILQYLTAGTPDNITFSERFAGSARQMYQTFAAAVEELSTDEGVKVELWLNFEAFEYLRDTPCLPVDRMGNGMAEILQRTSKSRADWSLTEQGAYVSHVISFAWDADYLCVPAGTDYTMSLADEIYADFDRPIASDASWDAAGSTLTLHGFNIASSSVQLRLQWTDTEGAAHAKTVTPAGTDAQWGTHNGRPALMGEATYIAPLKPTPTSNWYVIATVTDTRTGKQALHPLLLDPPTAK